MYRSSARAHVRFGIAAARPFDASLEMRVHLWLARIARLIEKRDTPQRWDAPPRAPDKS